jgi:hypothetical protein
MGDHAIRFLYYSREDLLAAGCLEMKMAMGAARLILR